MKKFLLSIISILFIYQLNAQILEIPYSDTNVMVTISGSIYYPNGGPEYDDDIYGVAVLYVRNGGDGSISTGKIYEGTNYYKSNPDTLQFISNTGTNSLYVYALDWERNSLSGTLTGHYNVNVNGVNYVLDTSNIVYLLACNSVPPAPPIIEIPYSGSNVTVTVSGSIYYPNGGPEYDDDIYGVTLLYVTDGGDGSISRGNIYEGTNYYKSNPDTLQFTSNIGTQSLYVYALDWERNFLSGTLTGHYNVTVNGVNYVLDTSNVVYFLPCDTVSPGLPSGLNDFDNNSCSKLLKQNFPNPLYHSTTINYFIKYAGLVNVNIFDASGNLIKNLVNGKKAVGEHSVIWNGDNNNGNSVPAGKYFYQIRNGDLSQSKIMILLK